MDASPSTMASTFPSGKRPKAAQLSRCRVSGGAEGSANFREIWRNIWHHLARISDATLILEGIKLDDLEYK